MVVVKQIEPTISLRSKQREIFENDCKLQFNEIFSKILNQAEKHWHMLFCFKSAQLKLSILEYNEWPLYPWPIAFYWHNILHITIVDFLKSSGTKHPLTWKTFYFIVIFATF